MRDLRRPTIAVPSPYGLIISRASSDGYPTEGEGAVGDATDGIVAIERLLEHDAPKPRSRLPRGALLGAVLSSLNFDPAEDHPYLEFGFVDVLINDFRDINERIDTLEGVTSEQFARILSWGPRIDPATTKLFAFVAPDWDSPNPYGDREAALRLGQTLNQNGYGAIIFDTGYNWDLRQRALLYRFAEAVRSVAPLLTAVCRMKLDAVPDATFSMQFRIEHAP